MFLALLLQLVLLVHVAVGDQVEISLNGDSWSLSDTDGRVKGIKAQVPGSVHLDLMYVCTEMAWSNVCSMGFCASFANYL